MDETGLAEISSSLDGNYVTSEQETNRGSALNLDYRHTVYSPM